MNLCRNSMILERKKAYSLLCIMLVFKQVRISELESQQLNLAKHDQMGKVLARPLKTQTSRFEWRISPGDMQRLAQCSKVGKTRKVIEQIGRASCREGGAR